MVKVAEKQRAKRKGNPVQLFPELSMMAWMTFGPITLEALFERPNKPKNYGCNHRSPRLDRWYVEYTYHVFETGRT